ncbi:MAG: HD domain-containing protein [Candidatus Brocadiia bacterium]
MVAHRLWDDVLGDGLRQTMAASLGLSPDDAGRWVAFWAWVHRPGRGGMA